MSMFFRWLVFGLAALLFNFPLISTLLTSLKSEGEIVSNPSILIRKSLMLDPRLNRFGGLGHFGATLGSQRFRHAFQDSFSEDFIPTW